MEAAPSGRRRKIRRCREYGSRSPPAGVAAVQFLCPTTLRQRDGRRDRFVVRVKNYKGLFIPAPAMQAADAQPVPSEHFHAALVRLRQCADAGAQLDQATVELPQPAVQPCGMPQGMVELGAREGLFILGVRRLVRPFRGRPLGPAPLADRLDQVRVGMADEKRERGRLAVFFPHEQQGQAGRKQNDAGRHFEGLLREGARQPVAPSAVSHLVVVLCEHHQPVRGDVAGGVAVAALAEFGNLAGIDKPLPQRLQQLLELPEIPVIALAFSGDHHMQGVVKIVVPLGVEAHPPQFGGADQPGVVQGAFGDEINPATQVRGFQMNRPAEFFQERPSRKVPYGVHRIQAQGIDMELRDPVEGVFDEETAHLVTVGPVEVQRSPPGGAVEIGKVGAELGKVIAFRSEVVVDGVQNHGQPFPVAGVDKPLQPGRTAVGTLYGKGVDPVIAPVALSRELGYGHQFHSGDAQRRQPVQVIGHPVERAFRCEGAHVEFVEDVTAQGWGTPLVIRPIESCIHHLRRTVHPLGLKPGGRVGTFQACIEPIQVKRTRVDIFQDSFMVAVRRGRQEAQSLPRGQKVHMHRFRQRRPDAEPAASVAERNGSQRRPVRGGRRGVVFLSRRIERHRLPSFPASEARVMG